MAKRERKERVKLKKGAYKRAFRAFAFGKPFMGSLMLSMVFLVLSSLTTLAFPYLLGGLFGSEGTSEKNPFELTNLDNINVIMVLMFMVFGANAVFGFFRIYFSSRFAESTLSIIRKKAFQRLAFSEIGFYDQNQVGELSSRVATDLNSLNALLSTTLAEFIRQWITIILGIAVIATISPKLLGVMLSVVPVVIILIVIFGRIIKKISKRTQDALAESNSILGEMLTGIKNVKAFGNEFFEMAKFGVQSDRVRSLAIKGFIARGLFASFIILGLFGGISFVIYMGYKMTLEPGGLTMEEFQIFIFFTAFLAASFGGVGSLMGEIQRAVGATERLMDLLENPNEEISQNFKPIDLKGEVRFENVGFVYDSRKDVTVLDDVSFSVSPGEIMAIVGPSGAGKSTITALLLRFYQVSSGKILFDGKDISDYELSALRNEMAIVPQEVMLFAGSIKENIAYGNVEATEEEIVAAAKQANAWEFIANFPDGLDTLVGDRGVQLSGGQKQRVAIARAILKDPKILILDEATSSLDSESEKLVQDALDKLMRNRTSIVIAHRLSTIKNANNILVLEKGKVVELGKHDELIHKDGLYTKLSKLQFNV
ncbi:ABC transporter ATP-binding protein [Parvicella tangerina]|uniref:ABC transporter ATP-binding protein n=1 Tax=Parvicella tangerina TaxID=2829795 RepID=A0A916JMI7_9FLAO|nr:ABC transporter transmembrane domain-containing protein [Parvicella tangerina]CAG5079598.1 putative ABC transporter ATP-binding protein [Parvicella tangerina]